MSSILVFHAFKKGELDILVATSIVENGIDIPNANTIIVDNADHFGIADLYQLRGRVGRWNRRAFAYFIIPKRSAAFLRLQKNALMPLRKQAATAAACALPCATLKCEAPATL